MKSELIIDVRPTEASIALLEDSRLVSMQKESRDSAYSVGDIYLGKVKKLLPGLNAAFIDVGYDKEAFLHYLDLGSQFASFKSFIANQLANPHLATPLSKTKLLPDIDKRGVIADQLEQGMPILVQIAKEPISTKGPRLSAELSFIGRYLILTPFNDRISISQKIKSTEEKLRLRQLVESIRPKNFGVIVRTSAEGKRVAELDAEMKVLVRRWEDAITMVQKATKTPQLCFEETGRAVAMLRDLFDPLRQRHRDSRPNT